MFNIVAGRWLNRIALAFAWLMAVGVLLSVPLLTLSLLRGDIGPAGFAACAVLALLAAAATFALRAPLLRWLHRATAVAGHWPARRWLLAVLLGGMALRLLWFFAFPAQASSDGATYLKLAQQLARGEPYLIDGTYAFWPPGYPFFLLPWVLTPLSMKAITLLSNLLLFALTLPVVWRLAQHLAGPAAARLATVLLAIWPNYLANVSTPEKENLLLLLLPAIFLLYCTTERAWPRWVAGLLLGFATLAQPSLALFPSVFVCYELCQRSGWRRAAVHLALLGAGMALVIAPWTLRNVAVLGEPVLVTANGGDNLYRANNPLATGGYTERGEVDLSDLGELERNREAMRLAKAWIASHPQQFFALVLVKQMRFLGDDSTGVYNSLRRGEGATPMTFFAFKGVANGFWYALWAVLLLALWQRRGNVPADALETALILGFAYFFTLHSVFESNGKYHLPALALLAVAFAGMAVRAAPASVAARPPLRSAA